MVFFFAFHLGMHVSSLKAAHPLRPSSRLVNLQPLNLKLNDI